MASSNLSYSGHTTVIAAKAYVTELTTSGTTRRVNLRVTLYAKDYSGNRDSSYTVQCTQTGTYESVGMYQGFYINGDEQAIFNETFDVSIARGASTASINLSFTASLKSPSSGTKTITGSITTLTLTKEPAATPSEIRLSASSVQMGKKLLISLDSDNISCSHDLTYTFGGTTADIASGVGSSYDWTVPDLAAKCSDATSGKCTVTCKTYLEGTLIGTTTAELTLTVQDPTVPSAGSEELTLGSAVSVACRRNSANFTLQLELVFKDTVVSIASGSIDTANWTPGYDLAKQIPNLTYGTGMLKCVTFNGTAEVGTESVTVRLIVPENDVTRPAFTLEDLVLSPVSDLGEEFAGMYMRGKTGLKAEMTAVSEYSTIENYAITAGSASAEGNPAVIDLLVSEGEVKVTAKVTDARGFSTTVSTVIEVLPYRKPKVTPYTGYNSVICERATETGQLSAKGTYLAIRAGKSFSSVVMEGVEKNSCALRYRWKPNSAESFSEWIELLPEDSVQTEVSLLIGNVVASLKTSYTVEISAVDALDGEHVLTFQIMTEAVSFVLYDGEDGAGFGKHPEAPHVVDIASHMTLLVRGRLEVTGSAWTELGLADGVSESVYAHGRNEGSGCFYRISNGDHVHAAFNCGFAYAGTAVVINANPIPEKCRPAQLVSSICPVNDRGIALVSADPDGYLRVEWVQKLTDAVDTGAAEVIWIDGYLDYWT